jgi:hypothetical protein
MKVRIRQASFGQRKPDHGWDDHHALTCRRLMLAVR